MFNFNVVPLNIAELDRICEDIAELVKNGIITFRCSA